MGIITLFRRARRRRLARAYPFSDELWAETLASRPGLRRLSPEAAGRLRELATAFAAEKEWLAPAGLELGEPFRALVAARACLPLLGLPEGLDWYDDWSSLIVTPREYAVSRRDYDEAGVVHEYEDEFAGEAFELGPVALSKFDVEDSGWGDGYEVVVHEMAHKLDGRDGSFDGAPPLPRGMSSAAWRSAFSGAYEDLRAKAALPPRRRRGGKLRAKRGPRLDVYAAEGPDEFFAVSCEYFFDRPELLASEYPAVFEQLLAFFRRDPRG